MVAFAAVGAFFVLMRLSGTLQKHVFKPLTGPQVEGAKEIARRGLKSDNPKVRRKARQALDQLNLATRLWDIAEGWAYDDPVELIGDLGAMGVKLSLLRAGVALPARLGLAVGTKGAVGAVETFLQGIQGLIGGDPQTAASDIAKGLDGFVENLAPDFVTPELIDSGVEVAVDIASFAGEAGEFVSKASSGDVLGSLVSGGQLLKKGLDVLGSFLGFVSQAQEDLPEAPPVGRTITDAELRRFQEARREKPPSVPSVWRPGRDVIPISAQFLEPWELRDIHGAFMGVVTPRDLRVSLMQFGGLLMGGSLRALKDQKTATTFPFG